MAMTTEETIGGQTSGRGDFARGVNVSDTERVLSAFAGGAFLLYGLSRRTAPAWALAGLGAALAFRGLTGVSYLYRLLGIDRSPHEPGALQGNLGIKVERSIVVDAAPEKVYGLWQNFENLPRFMSHLERVEVLDRTRSRWTVKAPVGMTIKWDAEIINEIPNQLIAWRSVGDSLVRHAGSVRFERAPDGRATLIRVSLQYNPPGGELGHVIARLLGDDADQKVVADLRAFKRAVEAGEFAA